jgi:hypothetical protein
MANIELLDKALSDIDAEAFSWSQGTWVEPPPGMGLQDLVVPGPPPCGTAMCLAGHVAWEAGYRPTTEGFRYLWRPLDDHTGPAYRVSDLAARILGLNETDAARLFVGANTRDDLQYIRDELARRTSAEVIRR